jgi:serine O-acetyltransferase
LIVGRREIAMPSHLTGIRQDNVEAYDPLWARIRLEAEEIAKREPALGGFIFATVLNHARLEGAICHRLAQRHDHGDVNADLIRHAFDKVLDQHPELAGIFRADLAAVADRDPACRRVIEPLLYFKGFHALQTQRFANRLWKSGNHDFALYLQSQSSRVFGVDIHPAARIGSGIMLDHATGIVIGETAEVGDMSSLLHGVTLGGSGKEGGDRHPKVGRNVMIGAGAKILGNIKVGNCARVAAGSVVLKDVPPNTTVAGVPAKVVGKAGCPDPARSMNQMLGLDDPSPVGETDG